MQQLNLKFLNLPEGPEARLVEKAARAMASARAWASEARVVGLPDLLAPAAGSDLRALLAEQARARGVVHLSASIACTRDDPRFFSHRGGDVERQVALIANGINRLIE